MVNITQPLATTRCTLGYLKGEIKNFTQSKTGYIISWKQVEDVRMSGSGTFHLWHSHTGRTLNKERFRF